MRVRFIDWDCDATFHRYGVNERICIKLIDAEDGSPVATATINLTDEYIHEGHVAIKDYSENIGMPEALIDAGIILPDMKNMIKLEHGSVPVYELSNEAKVEAVCQA